MSKYAKERQDNRMKDYKSSFNAEEYRKRREESLVTIRRQRREENISKRRNMDIPDEPVDIKLSIQQRLQALPDYVRECQSPDVHEQLNGTIGIRRLLSIQQNPPIDEILKAGVVPILVAHLGNDSNPKLQFEAAWALTNIASGTTEQTMTIIRFNAVPAFVRLLDSPEVSVKEQAVWALGNIAGDSYVCRDALLEQNVLNILLPRSLDENYRLNLRRNIVWTISNLCRGKPAPPFQVVSPAIPFLAQLIRSQDQQLVTDSSWALSYLSDGDNTNIQAVLDAGIVDVVVSNLGSQSLSIQTPSLRIVGNIVTGDNNQTQTVLDRGVLPKLKRMLDDQTLKKAVKKEVCWTISNITAGPAEQIQAVMHARIFESLVEQLRIADFDIKKEAAWGIANASSSGTLEQIRYLVHNCNCIEPLGKLLEQKDARIVAVALEALENILDKGEDENEEQNPYALIVEEYEIVKTIEDLQDHINQPISEKAGYIIGKFYEGSTDNEESDVEIQEEGDGSAYIFNAGNQQQQFSFS